MAKLPLKTLWNPITIITCVILLTGLLLGSLAVIFLGRNGDPTSAAVPAVTIIPASTITPTAAFPTAGLSPTPTTIFFLPEGVIGVGAFVQVAGTEGAGLRMRSEPGLESQINFTALDSEVFLVIDGPVEADGYTWWHLEAPYDQNRNGWSAGNFLTRIEEESD